MNDDSRQPADARPPLGTPLPAPAGAGEKKKARPRWVIPLASGGVLLLLCCVGAIAVVGTSDDTDGGPGAAAGSPTAGAAPGNQDDGSAEPAGDTDTGPEPEPVATESAPEPDVGPEPAGFGAGVWEVGAEIPAGTYVTVAPDGGVFDSCYWARLSGFTGDFDDIIANDNLNAGARGRLSISDSDAGVEFSGDCRWVEVSEADPVEVGAEVGEGVWAVGDEIQPGTYATDAPGGDALDSCYWARLSGFSGEFDHVIANDIVEAGSRGRVEVAPSDAGVLFSGDCLWTRN